MISITISIVLSDILKNYLIFHDLLRIPFCQVSEVRTEI